MEDKKKCVRINFESRKVIYMRRKIRQNILAEEKIAKFCYCSEAADSQTGYVFYFVRTD